MGMLNIEAADWRCDILNISGQMDKTGEWMTYQRPKQFDRAGFRMIVASGCRKI
jgi:hypothetical protein